MEVEVPLVGAGGSQEPHTGDNPHVISLQAYLAARRRPFLTSAIILTILATSLVSLASPCWTRLRCWVWLKDKRNHSPRPLPG